MTLANKISPFLWFDGRAKEAANFYVSVFKDANILNVSQLEAGPAEGNHLVEFELEGLKFTTVDALPAFEFTSAISFVVSCDTQEEIDHFWESLSEGGEQEQCGWLKDKFGVSWQVVPSQLPELMARAQKEVIEAFLPMKKINLARLREAAGI